MSVLVIGKNGRGLMPTTERKARLLVKENKATVVRKNPYTIQLTYTTGCATQPVTLGIDTGSQHIGIAVVSEDEVLQKVEVALRTTMSKRKLIESRASLRRGRRHRKTRYRKPKTKRSTKRVFSPIKNGEPPRWHKVSIKGQLETKREDGWLPPTIEQKVEHHKMWINRYLEALPDNTELNIEVARFDIQHMKDPTIHGELYQKGRMYDYENKKAYVLAKYNYTCPICGKKFDDEHRVRLHHLGYKSKGETDNPDAYAPICEVCHAAPHSHDKGGPIDSLRRKSPKPYRDATFMNVLRQRLCSSFSNATFTYGNITNADRNALGLEKTHANDAIAIAMLNVDTDVVIDNAETVYIQQVRKKKRSLHETNPRKGTKDKPNRQQKRNNKNTPWKDVCIDKKKGIYIRYALFDKVKVFGQIGWITSFNSSGARVVDANNEYIKKPGNKDNVVSLRNIRIISRNNNWVVGAMCQLGKK